MKKKIAALLLVLSLALALAACGGVQGKCDNCGKTTTVHPATVNDKEMNLCTDCMMDLVKQGLDSMEAEEAPAPEISAHASAVSQPETPPPAEPKDAPLTLADIEARSGDDFVCVTNDAGHVTFLAGDCYDGTVLSEEDADKAVDALLPLAGGDDETGLRFLGYLRGNDNHAFYIYNQWSGETSVPNAVFKLIVGPDGKVEAVSSSIHPDVPANWESTVTEEEALNAAKEALAGMEPDKSYYFYEDSTEKTVVRKALGDGGNAPEYMCYAVYTDNPGAAQGEPPFVAHYVTSEGNYLYSLPVQTIGSAEAEAGVDTDKYFEGRPDSYTGEVTWADGSKETITVPVVYKEAEDCYYLMDQARKIAVGDFYSFMYGDELEFVTSRDNADWDNNSLLLLYCISKVYDVYAEYGWPSTDGRGTPIFLSQHTCDQDHNPLGGNSASIEGFYKGWQLFCDYDTGDAYQCLDVAGHEYGHGIHIATNTYINYANQPGAIAESLADIFGNITEMRLGETEDATWLCRERFGKPYRCMTDPHRFYQPAFVGDVFSTPDTDMPLMPINDNGGVHVRNSILAGVAPMLHEAGMPLETQQQLWITVACAMTPESGFAEINEILRFSAEKVMDIPEYAGAIAEACAATGIDGTVNPVDESGYARLRMSVEPWEAGRYVYGLMLVPLEGEFGTRQLLSWPETSASGECSALLPEGAYLMLLKLLDMQAGEMSFLYWSGDGWTEDSDGAAPFAAAAGEELAFRYEVE